MESEAKYRDLYDKSPDMYFSTYPSDHLIYDCNLTLAATLGYSRDELIGQPTQVLFAPTSLDYIVATLPALIAAQHISHLDVQLRHGDGSLLDALASVVLEPVRDGPPLGRVTLKDISERKRMEVALRESERALRGQRGVGAARGRPHGRTPSRRGRAGACQCGQGCLYGGRFA